LCTFVHFLVRNSSYNLNQFTTSRFLLFVFARINDTVMTVNFCCK